MKTIEEIAAAFEALAPASENVWNVVSLFPGRLHISRAADGTYAVFIEGSQESFGKLPTVGGLEHSAMVTALPASRTFAALRMTSRDTVHGNRVLSHIAYELARRLEELTTVSNEELFRQVEWVLLLLGAGDAMLSPERQSGLVGECTLLRRLLIVGRAKGVTASSVLTRWWGHDTSRRDFAAVGIAVEVKTTGMNSRQHHIGSLEQLDPQNPDEKVYLYSLGIKVDATSARKLPHFIADVEAQIINSDGTPDAAGLVQFRAQLAAYGYDVAREAAYLGGPGYMKPHLPGAFFREQDLDRVRQDSFVAGALPSMVRGIAYVLEITCDPISEADVEEVLSALVSAPAATYQ